MSRKFEIEELVRGEVLDSSMLGMVTGGLTPANNLPAGDCNGYICQLSYCSKYTTCVYTCQFDVCQHSRCSQFGLCLYQCSYA